MVSNKRIVVGIILAFVFCLSLTASAQIGVRVLLGVTDEASVNWDGSLTADGARVTRIDPWRFGKDDELKPDNSWTISTRPVLSFMHLVAKLPPPVGDNGFIVWLSEDNPNAQVSVRTKQGNFTCRLSDLPYGKFVYELGGRVAIDRVPANWQLTNSPDEEDDPAAAAGPNGEIWLA